jgi:hypothetical protein
MKITQPKRGRPDSTIITDSWRSRTEAAIDRLGIQQSRWIEAAPLTAAWSGLVRLVSRQTRPWPKLIADRLEMLTPAQAARESYGDRPLVPRVQQAGECRKAESLVRELIADPAGWPRAEAEILTIAAERGVSQFLTRREAIRRGITITAGFWHPPTESGHAWLSEEVKAAIHELDMIEARRLAPRTLFRPLLTDLSARVEASRAAQALSAALKVPAAPRLPPKPSTSAGARSQCLSAQAKLLRLKVGIERGQFLKRRGVERAVTDSISTFKFTWWHSWSESIPEAGDRAAVLAAAETIRSRALVELAALGGMLKPKAPSRRAKKSNRIPTSPRRTTKGRKHAT